MSGPKRQGFNKVCKCGTEFYAYPGGTKQFCTPECGHRWQRRPRAAMARLVCEFCKNEYLVVHWRASKSRFCSQKCDIFSRQGVAADLSKLKFTQTSNGDIIKFSKDVKKARSQFFDQRVSARWRGIEFKLSFDEWWEIWQKSGHWQERGRGVDKYCMARIGDKGAYEVGNVKIVTGSRNSSEKTMPSGEKSATAKLTDDEVREIRRLEGTMERRAIAKMFNVNYWHVRDIQKFKARKDT